MGDELLAGGAACAGFKAFEDHQRREGKTISSVCCWFWLMSTCLGRPMSHGVAKSLLAGFAAAEVDRIARKRGEGWFDKEKAKHRAKKNAEQLYDEHYIQRNGADQYDPVQTNQPQILERIDVL